MVDKRALASRLVTARSRILRKYPFFGTLLMRLQFGISDCGTAYTDMKHIIVDPEFVGRLPDKELDFLLMHELLHCVLKHCTRGRDKIQYIYNIACDIVVNSNILECMQCADFKVDGEFVMHFTPSGKEGRLYTADAVYYELMKQGTLTVKDEDGQDQVISIGELSPLDSHDEWSLVVFSEDSEDMWDKQIEDYIRERSEKASRENGENGTSKGFSTFGLPQAARDIAEELMLEAQIRWKDALRRFVEQTLEISDYSFAPPDRRFTDSQYILPGDNTYYADELSNIWFCVDTSGSVSQDELTRLMFEVKNVIEECPGSKGCLSFFDTEVTEPIPFSREEDLEMTKPYGGGGTSFDCVFTYMQEHMMDQPPRAIVILTDGDAPDVDEEEAMGIPVVWVLIDNDLEEAKPWGDTIHVST